MTAKRRILVTLIALLGAVASERAGADPISGSQGARAAAAVDWAQAQPYPVILGEFHYQPHRIILRRGQPYVLRLQNAGRISHTFTAPSFFKTVRFRQDPAGKEAEASGGLVLAAGEAVEIGLVPLQAGSYALECTKPLHGLFGMSGDILVD